MSTTQTKPPFNNAAEFFLNVPDEYLHNWHALKSEAERNEWAAQCVAEAAEHGVTFTAHEVKETLDFYAVVVQPAQ